MKLATTIKLYAGGPGSGCNPEAAEAAGTKCGRPPKKGSEEERYKLTERVTSTELAGKLEGLGLVVKNRTSGRPIRAHLLAADGVKQAVKELKAQGLPIDKLGEVYFALHHTEQHDTGIMATESHQLLSLLGGPQYVTINTAFNPIKMLRDTSLSELKENGSLASIWAKQKLEETGSYELAVKELYRAATLHEFGHVLHNRQPELLQKFVHHVKDLYAKNVTGHVFSVNGIQKDLSPYGASSPAEGFAEAMAFLWSGKPLPNKYTWLKSMIPRRV